MKKTIFNAIHCDWMSVKNVCRTTVNKEHSENYPTEKFKKDLLIAEHSPIRLIEVFWSWKNIPYWVSTEWSRHKFEKFISTQRTDRTGIDRSKKPQDSPVCFDGFANVQNLIDVFRKRLCKQASPEARELAEDFKYELSKNNERLADVLVPNCIYRCGCPEPHQCGFFKTFIENMDCSLNIVSIRGRYEEYNSKFYSKMEEQETKEKEGE